MTSRLENLDATILRIIAFFHFTSASLGTPQVLQLLMVSRAIHKALNPRDCPELYADVFYVYFDAAFQGVLYPDSSLTVDRLAPELVHRLHVLRRIRLVEFSEQHLRTDLWTVYLMVLEGGGRNEIQLAMAGISRFIFTLIRHRLGEEYAKYGRPLMNEINALALWLACLTTSPRTFANEGRDELYDLIRPFAITSANCRQEGFLAWQNFSESSMALSDLSFGIDTSDLSSQGICEVLLYSERCMMSCPNISSASIFLAFLLKDISPLDAPSHLPQTQAIAAALQREGLTLEDYALILQSKTPNIADPGCQTLGARIYKDDFSRAIRNSPSRFFSPTRASRAYAPGMLTGEWEGQFMTSRSVPDCGPPDFISRQPIQFVLDEKLNSCPEGALPPDIVGINNVHDEDVMIIGESRGTYDQACGGFRYAGKVRLRDGLIFLKRESAQKGADPACHGSWVFECYLHARCVLIGRWYGATQSVNDTRSEGVFCMSKRPDCTSKVVDCTPKVPDCTQKRPEVLVRDTSWPSRL